MTELEKLLTKYEKWNENYPLIRHELGLLLTIIRRQNEALRDLEPDLTAQAAIDDVEQIARGDR